MRARAQAFQDFANLYKRSAENIALYADRIMRNSSKDSESNVEQEMDRTITLFRFLQVKTLCARARFLVQV